MDEDYSIGDVVKCLKELRKKKTKTKSPENSPLSDLFGNSSCSSKNIDFYCRYLKNIQSDKSSSALGAKVNSAEKKEKSQRRKNEIENASETVEEENASSQESSAPVKDADSHVALEKPEEEEEQNLPDASKDSRTIFVGNVPKKVEKKTLEKIFQEYGLIESIRVRSLAPGQQGMSKQVVGKTKDINDRRTNYNAYIVFCKEGSAEKALEKNGELLDGHHLRVDLTMNDRKKVDSKQSVFIGSLPYDVREEDVRRHFEDFGDLESVRLIRDPETGMGKGFGFIVFKDDSAVALALKMKDHILQGRRIRVKPVENVKKQKIPKSPHQNKRSSNQQRRLNPKTLKRIHHKKKLGMKKSGEGVIEGNPGKKHEKFHSKRNNKGKLSDNQAKQSFDRKKKFPHSNKGNFTGQNQNASRKENFLKRKHAGHSQMKSIQAPAGKKIKFD